MRSYIRTGIANKKVPDIEDEETAIGLWRKLDDLFQGRNIQNVMMLKKQFYQLRMYEGEALADYLHRFMAIAREVKHLDASFFREGASSSPRRCNSISISYSLQISDSLGKECWQIRCMD